LTEAPGESAAWPWREPGRVAGGAVLWKSGSLSVAARTVAPTEGDPRLAGVPGLGREWRK
ncbi:MAG: hypothetical protein K9H11_18925, partial [Rhodospirillum sp.]|nr:hypothetical protein [Rhodospirillum sp.]